MKSGDVPEKKKARKKKKVEKKTRRIKSKKFDSSVVVEALEGVLGNKNVMMCSDSDQGEPRMFIPSGVPDLDEVLHRDALGYPCGRIIELYGAEQTAKTAFGYALIAEAQNMGGLAILYPVEGNIDAWLATRYGVDLDKLIIGDSETVEGVFESFNRAMLAAPKNTVMVGMIDSIAGLSTREEMKAAKEGKPIGRDRSIQLRALLLSQALRRIGTLISKTNSILFCVNQVRDNTDAGPYEKKSKPPGGRALKFYASIRLELSILKRVKQTRNKKKFVTGFHLNVTAVKNRLARPYQEASILLDFERGLLPIRKRESLGDFEDELE